MTNDLQLHILDGGSIEILDWSIYDPAAPRGSHRTLADPVYLVVHPRGTLVWDGGLSDGLAHRDEPLVVDDHAVFRVTDSVERQLAALGHPADEINFLALSHFHPDHVGNVGLFTGATLLSQRDEYEAAFGDRAGEHHYDPVTYASLADHPVTLLEGDHDVFGDGTVVVKRLSGHTVGNQSLLVRLPERGSVLISGDLSHSLENWETRAIPQVLNYDIEESSRSLEKAAAILEEEQAELWVQHDDSQYRWLRAEGPAFT
jgi:N-acyl homoserine lactone hydrolase